MNSAQVLTVAQMQAAEQAIFDAGTSVDELMDIAGSGAAEWIRRVAAGRSVTVLCGPGNNGGDGYVIARRLREFGNPVTVVAPLEPSTEAARNALQSYGGTVQTSGKRVQGDIFVDCLFGSGLSRPLSPEHALLLRDLAERHAFRIAVDLPSGVESDSGALLNERLPDFDLTLCLGAWKFAHWKLPARRNMGIKRLVPIGIDATEGAACLVGRPNLAPPEDEDHKYTRGLCLVIAGAMPGASLLSCQAAMRAGAGYVQLASEAQVRVDADLVIRSDPLERVLDDRRIDALLIGPGLGRDSPAAARLGISLESRKPGVIDADGLILLRPETISPDQQVLLTPHDGELENLCRSFSVLANGRQDRAQALAKASRAVVLAKGPDTVIAHPDGRIALAPPAPSWLSVAGSGDVLAGIAVGRMAAGKDCFTAACEAVWLHGQAARMANAPFTASQLAHSVQSAYAAAL